MSGHGHSHGHGPLAPASRRVRRILFAITAPLIIANVIAMAALWSRGGNDSRSSAAPGSVPALIAATVVDLDLVDCLSQYDAELGSEFCLEATVKLHGKTHGGTQTKFQQNPSAPGRLRIGDNIYVTQLAIRDGAPTYGFYEYRRERPLVVLAIAFVVAAIAVGRRSGFRAILALALSLLVLTKFMLPAIVAGENPLLVALVGASGVMFLALYLSHGINVRTTSAVIGTVVSLAITGFLAMAAVNAAKFTGFSDEETGYLGATAGQIDLRGLLLAGIIIGALGVLDDVTITQSSAVWELHQANPYLGFRGRFDAALRIGRDHIASVVNTLVLAYAGAALPLLLLFTTAGTPLNEVLNGEPVATEIVRMLAGSIGLMAAVPITTALTAFVVGFDHVDGVQPAQQTEHRPAKRSSGPQRRSIRSWQPPKAEREFRGDAHDD